MNIKTAALLPLSLEHKPALEKILKALESAFREDKELTIQMLLYIRDKNNWAWRREFTRTALLWLKRHHEETFNKVILDFLLVWRWDDIFFSCNIINDHVVTIISNHLANGDTLLKKWLPKESSNPDVARMLARWLGLTMKEYRLAIKRSEWSFVNTLFRPIDSYQVNL